MARVTEDVWARSLDLLRETIGDNNVRAWISKARVEMPADEPRITLHLPNEFYARWIRRRFLGAIQQAVIDTADEPIEVLVEVDDETPAPRFSRGKQAAAPTNGRSGQHHPDLFAEGSDEAGGDGQESLQAPSATRGMRRAMPSVPAEDAPAAEEQAAFALSDAAPQRAYNRLNPRYKLDEFVVGESNRYAYAASVALTEQKSNAFTPLFIYGGTGLGKTHLMQGIGHRLLEKNPSLKVLYVTSEEFINHFIDSIQHRRPNEFRAFYRSADILFIDDVQFLMGKDKSQTEFFHTFNALCESGKKVVVTSDRAPKGLQAMEDRLRSRFEWGLLVDIQPPDLETRVAILRKKAETERMMLPNDVAIFLAERVTNNVRELEGTLKRLRVFGTLHGRSLDLALAKEMLGGVAATASGARAIAIEDVQHAVSDYFQIRMTDLLGKNRSKKFSRPRHIAQFLCRKITESSFPDIAVKFGGKDHTSIIYAVRKIEGALRTDTALANIVSQLEETILRGSTES